MVRPLPTMPEGTERGHRQTVRRALAAALTLFPIAAALVLGFAPDAADGQDLGRIVGTVRVARPPVTRTHRVRRQQDVCGREVPNDSVVVGPGGQLAGVVAWIEGLPRPAGQRPEDVTLDQVGCRFEPHVQSATLGANLRVTSRDPILHTAHAALEGGGGRTLFNVAIPIAGMVVRKPLRTTGRIRFRCDVGHTWMSAYLLVFPHPYHSVTSSDGTFEIPRVPPGTHRLGLWHERLGERATTVTLSPGGTARVTARF